MEIYKEMRDRERERAKRAEKQSGDSGKRPLERKINPRFPFQRRLKKIFFRLFYMNELLLNELLVSLSCCTFLDEFNASGSLFQIIGLAIFRLD